MVRRFWYRHGDTILQVCAWIVGATLLLGLFRSERALVEDVPARAAFVAWAWLPSRLVAWVLGLLALVPALGALALAGRLPWLLVRPGSDHLTFDWTDLRFRPAMSRAKSLAAEGKLLLVLVAIAAAAGGLSCYYGLSERLELDLAERTFRRRSEYLGLVTITARERPLREVLRADMIETRHEDDEGDVSYTYELALHLADDSYVRVDGPERECERAKAAFDRVLADRWRLERPEAPVAPAR